MVGKSLTRAIDRQAGISWVGFTRDELDLRNRPDVMKKMARHSFDAVIVAAAKVGGILENQKYPVNFLSENLQIQTNLIDSAYESKVSRLVFLGSSCIYPKQAKQPLLPEYLLTGPLEETNKAYALAKIAGLELVNSYRQQYGKQWISLMPTNLYGPGDNFDPQSSHVIPGLVAKFVHARKTGAREVILWGTGSPRREFLHVNDLAEATLFALSNYDDAEPLNVGSGEELSIQELAEIIREATGYRGNISWDETKPDGTPRKLLNSDVLRHLGWRPKIGLEEGVKSVVAEYEWSQGAL